MRVDSRGVGLGYVILARQDDNFGIISDINFLYVGRNTATAFLGKTLCQQYEGVCVDTYCGIFPDDFSNAVGIKNRDHGGGEGRGRVSKR